MKVLVDENINEEFPEFMPAHDVFHVVAMAWQGTLNGQLLAKAQEAEFQVFITADKNMEYRQSMKGRAFPLIVLDIHPNILAHPVACIPAIEERIKSSVPGQVYRIEGYHSRRRKLNQS